MNIFKTFGNEMNYNDGKNITVNSRKSSLSNKDNIKDIFQHIYSYIFF